MDLPPTCLVPLNRHPVTNHRPYLLEDHVGYPSLDLFQCLAFNRPSPQFSLTPITVSHLPTPANITCLSTCFPRQDRRQDRLLTHRPPPLSWCTHDTSPNIPALLPIVMSKPSTQDTVLTTRSPAYNKPQRSKDQR